MSGCAPGRPAGSSPPVTIVTQLAGAEIIRVQGRDLETSNGFGLLRSTRRYRGGDIKDLSSSNPSAFGMPFRMPSLPFVKPFAGALKFHYGASTVYLASSSEEAEGQMIVDWLKPRLPPGASEYGQREEPILPGQRSGQPA